jgi:hypothetical protein
MVTLGGVFALFIIPTKKLALELKFYSVAKKTMISFGFIHAGIKLVLILGGAFPVLACVGSYENLCQKQR